MKINFDKIYLYHFLSFGEAEINLKDKGYTLVSGVNKCHKDLALSNGSGKSTIWSAICYALTGETIQGLSSNIENIKYEDGCYVDLTFYIDGIRYRVIRYKNYKGEKGKIGTDLRFFINDENKSGKGIRESEAILKQYLPDLTSELIGSVIILGQGLPHKFSDNSPSGRKDILEKLSKSDFMIKDIKDRMDKRTNALNLKLRNLEDKLLSNNSAIRVYNQQLGEAQNDLKSYEIEPNYNLEIEQKSKELNNLEVEIAEILNNLNDKKVLLNKDQSNYNILLENKNNQLYEAKTELNSQSEQLTVDKIKLENNIRSLEREIINLKNIVDVCPTCHQKLPGVLKPDTTEKENEVVKLKEDLNVVSKNISTLNEAYNVKIANIAQNFNYNQSELTNTINNLNQEINGYNQNYNYKNNIIKNNLINDINKLKLAQDNFLTNKNNLEEKVVKLNNSILNLNNESIIIDKDKMDVEEHIGVLNKINTLVKRDFRGVLLGNVIDFINKKAKEYCLDVFETDEIDFVLEGNNINITYCNKAYENLSGGEKQKVNLIVQFAIRDMLRQYLDFSSNILVLDEIFDNLDSIGCSKILDLISNKLTDVESIFIITHHTFDLAIPYDDEIIVEKNEEGVSSIK